MPLLLGTTKYPEWKQAFDVCWRIMKGTANITKKVFLSLADSFCFVNFCGGYLFSILVEIYDIFVEE